MFIVTNTYIKMANSSNEKKITWGSPFSWKGPQFHIKIGTLGSPKYYEIRDGGPRFHMKLGTRGPHFGGPHSHMTPFPKCSLFGGASLDCILYLQVPFTTFTVTYS